jgi:hypothetical protein
MKTNILELKIGDLVYSIQDHNWFQIRNNEHLKEVEKLWGMLYHGLELSQEIVDRFWSDFLQKYHSEYVIRFDYTDEVNGNILFSFFAEYSQNNLDPLVKGSLLEDSWIGEGDGFLQYFLDSTVCNKCYYFQKGRKVYFKYVHELQGILDNHKIGRCIYGIMNWNFVTNSDLEEIED